MTNFEKLFHDYIKLATKSSDIKNLSKPSIQNPMHTKQHSAL